MKDEIFFALEVFFVFIRFRNIRELLELIFSRLSFYQ